jgi:hypothetical protein
VRAAYAPVGAVVCDSLPFSQSGTAAQAAELRASGVDALACYLGVLSPARLALILDAGLGYVPVSLAGEYEDGPVDELAQLRALGIPSGVVVWLDLEGMRAFRADPETLIAKIDAWADAIAAAGYVPGLYVGVPQPLTSAELTALHVVRYWRGQGSIRDRHNALAEPGPGWCMVQFYPSVTRGGVLVDANMVGQDYRARVPTWATRGPLDAEVISPAADTLPALPVEPLVIVHPVVETVGEAQRRDE